MLGSFTAVFGVPMVPTLFEELTFANDTRKAALANSLDAKVQQVRNTISTLSQRASSSPKTVKCGSMLSHLSEWMAKASSTQGQNYGWQSEKQVSAYMCRFNQCIEQAQKGSRKDHSKSSAMFNMHPQLYGNGRQGRWSAEAMNKLPAL